MGIKNKIVKHYKDFFDLQAKGIALTEDDHLNLDWAESLIEDFNEKNSELLQRYNEAINVLENIKQSCDEGKVELMIGHYTIIKRTISKAKGE